VKNTNINLTDLRAKFLEEIKKSMKIFMLKHSKLIKLYQPIHLSNNYFGGNQESMKILCETLKINQTITTIEF